MLNHSINSDIQSYKNYYLSLCGENKSFSIHTFIEKLLLNLSPNDETSQIKKENTALMKFFAEENFFTSLIREVINNPKLLKEVANRSYKHVNHFYKIVLIDNKNPQGYRLTIHYWDCNVGDEIREQELIHNHRFSFWSHIYRGAILSENFIESNQKSVEKKDFKKYVYRPSKTGNIHSCQYDSDVQLSKLETTFYEAGDTYYLNYKTTHRVVLPRKQSLCTIVLRGPRKREFTNTYNTFYPDRGIESNVPMMSEERLMQLLTTILGDQKNEKA